MSALALRVARVILRALAISAALVMGYLAAGLLGGVIATQQVDTADPQGITIGLVAGPIHNDFLLPLDVEGSQVFADLAQATVPVTHPNAEWLMVGWGAREFYTTVGGYRDLTWRALRKAVLGDSAVMRVDVYGKIGDPAAVRWITLTAAQYQQLAQAIRQDFGPVPLPLDLATDGSARFFEARGHFNLLRNCNVWIGDRLRGAGVRFGVWTPMPSSVTLSLWRFHDR